MKRFDLLDVEMWECDRDELRQLWKSDPPNRWRLCSHAEVDAHMMDGPEEIREWIAKKKEKPGEYLG